MEDRDHLQDHIGLVPELIRHAPKINNKNSGFRFYLMKSALLMIHASK